jgi:LruC domain-containing protein
MMKTSGSDETQFKDASFVVDRNEIYLTDDITSEIGTTYVLEITYEKPLSSSEESAIIKPFIWRKNGQMNWEVHIPMEEPTFKMDINLFGTKDDCSNVFRHLYYVRQGNYPFAFYLNGASIDVFKETILKRENESIPIDVFFPKFIEWSTSGGEVNRDWYLKK